MSALYDRFYAVVRRIPRGRVASYGQVAELAGLPGRARQVGYALRALPADTVLPWHRVVDARGRLSPRADPDGIRYQRYLLEKERVEFGEDDRIPLERFGWRPRGARRETDT